MMSNQIFKIWTLTPSNGIKWDLFDIIKCHFNVGAHFVVCGSIFLFTSVYVCLCSHPTSKHITSPCSPPWWVEAECVVGWCIYSRLFSLGVSVWRFPLISKRPTIFDMGTHWWTLWKQVCPCVQRDVWVMLGVPWIMPRGVLVILSNDCVLMKKLNIADLFYFALS